MKSYEIIFILLAMLAIFVYLIYNRKKKSHENFCAFGIGDCETSSKMTINSLVDTVNEKMTNIVTTQVNNSSQNCSAVQNLKVKFGPNAVLVGCPVSATNVNATMCNMSAIFTQSGSNNLATLLNQAVENAATQSDTTTQGFLTTASSKDDSTINMATHIKNLVTTNITTEQLNTCIQNSDVTQNNEFEWDSKMDCTNGGEIIIGNTNQISSLSSCVTNQLMNILTNDSTVQNAIQKSSNVNVTTQTGLLQDAGEAAGKVIGSVGGAISDLLSGLSKPMIIIGIVIVIALGIAAYFLMSPAGQQLANKAIDKV